MKADPSIADKIILLSDDDEGNGYHVCYYEVTYDPKTVRECIEFSNGCGSDVDPANCVIVG